MNGIQAQVIIASLKTTIIATGGLPPGAIQDPQQVPAAQLGDEMVQEGIVRPVHTDVLQLELTFISREQWRFRENAIWSNR